MKKPPERNTGGLGKGDSVFTLHRHRTRPGLNKKPRPAPVQADHSGQAGIRSANTGTVALAHEKAAGGPWTRRLRRGGDTEPPPLFLIGTGPGATWRLPRGRLVTGDMTFLDSGAREPVALPARLFGEQEENLVDRLHDWLGW